MHSSQVHMEHSPRQNTFWLIKHTSANLKDEKSYQVFCQTTMELHQKLITERQLEKLQMCKELGRDLWNTDLEQSMHSESCHPCFLLCGGFLLWGGYLGKSTAVLLLDRRKI